MFYRVTSIIMKHPYICHHSTDYIRTYIIIIIIFEFAFICRMFHNSRVMLRLGMKNYHVRRNNSHTIQKPVQTLTNSAPTDGIGISESCVKRLKQLCEDDKNTFLRIAVESGGCSGFQYKFDLDNKVVDDDRLVLQWNP